MGGGVSEEKEDQETRVSRVESEGVRIFGTRQGAGVGGSSKVFLFALGGKQKRP